ncbi:PorV/PorQ family protein, partial [bacterium]|nr:PorV/PorQ family protein [bacterium]
MYILLLFLLIIPSFGFSRVDTGADFLKFSAGGRVAAIGGAFVGLADDVSCLHYNPAGLVNIKQRELLIMESEAIMECGYEYFGYVQPMREGEAMGVAILYFHAPRMDRLDDYGNVVGEFEYYDLSASLSYGTKIKRDLSLGGTIKLIRRMISPNNGVTGAIDLGLLYQAKKDFRLGASLQHFGPKVWGDRLPQLIQGGASYKIQDLILTGAISHHFIAGSDPEFRVGAEYWYWECLALRAGYYWLEG